MSDEYKGLLAPHRKLEGIPKVEPPPEKPKDKSSGNSSNSSDSSKPKRPELPEFDGVTTHGVLITPDGQQIPFSSGDPIPLYKNYVPSSHAEGKAAIYMRDNNIKEAIIYHNNTDGTCPYCNTMLATLLEEGSVLEVIPPENAKAPKPSWVDKPKTYTGNSSIPKKSI